MDLQGHHRADQPLPPLGRRRHPGRRHVEDGERAGARHQAVLQNRPRCRPAHRRSEPMPAERPSPHPSSRKTSRRSLDRYLIWGSLMVEQSSSFIVYRTREPQLRKDADARASDGVPADRNEALRDQLLRMPRQARDRWERSGARRQGVPQIDARRRDARAEYAGGVPGSAGMPSMEPRARRHARRAGGSPRSASLLPLPWTGPRERSHLAQRPSLIRSRAPARWCSLANVAPALPLHSLCTSLSGDSSRPARDLTAWKEHFP